LIFYLGAGVVLGLSAGFSPGPLFALVLSHTVRHGVREGIKIAVAPLLTDLPIILVSTFLLAKVTGSRAPLGVISLMGGFFLLYMSHETWTARRQDPETVAAGPQSLWKGVITNALSPHPYLFWLTVGAPTIIRGWETGPSAAVAFLAGFYGCLVGSKVFLAVLTARSKHLLTERAYQYLMRALGMLLLLFAGLLFRDGLSLLRLYR
jgi:threonine/homoserine/homoserine lactone efflux protein